MGGPKNCNFPLLYVMKISLHRGWVVLKSLKTPLGNIKMAPNFDLVVVFVVAVVVVVVVDSGV